MKIFLAGATGALGRQLVPRLVERGHEVTGITRSESKRRLVEEPASRTATLSSTSGPEMEALACTSPRLPNVTSARPSDVKLGARVVMLIAPAVVFLP